jgi:murein DD-endopeptidase MepM/ murein hydrolase activator NlpD
LRQQKVRFEPKRSNGSRRLSAAVSLAVSLILWLSPFVTAPVAAAPPGPIREATSGITLESRTGTDRPLAAEKPQLPDQFVADIAPRDVGNGGDGSVRPRGIEAPVQLEQPEAAGGERRQEDGKSAGKQEKIDKVEPDPGDGPVRKRQETATERRRAHERSDIRIWPMPTKSYTFSQHFGCVPQLGNLYFPGEGCPAGSPVIHTGIDLAAPEGTPFYAAASGWVTLADYDRPTADANTRIIIQHDGRNEGYATDYLHWVASYVEEGDYVHAGDPIGEVGNVGFSTGPHLHFSVTDLKTGEFTDPLRWLPDEPGLEGYVRRTPPAQLRLPAGTTAGQPESADPAPPPPPVKEKVPKSPPGDDTQGKPDEGKRGERDAKAGKESTANEAKRSDKKPPRDDAASEKSAEESASDAKNGQDGSPSREPSPERKKDDSPPAEAASGDDGASRDKRTDSSKAERRANREASNDAGGGGKEEPTQEPRERPARDRERRDSTGHDEQGGRDERGADRQDPDHGKPDSGGNDNKRERHRKS